MVRIAYIMDTECNSQITFIENETSKKPKNKILKNVKDFLLLLTQFVGRETYLQRKEKRNIELIKLLNISRDKNENQ